MFDVYDDKTKNACLQMIIQADTAGYTLQELRVALQVDIAGNRTPPPCRGCKVAVWVNHSCQNKSGWECETWAGNCGLAE